MKRLIITALLLSAVIGMAFAQDEIGVSAPWMTFDTAQQMLREVSVERFEREGFWVSSMSSDQGFATSRLFRGGPLGREPIAGEEDMDIPDYYVLGTRVDFLRRGHNTFYVRPIRPIPVEGVTKSVSMWVAGRNFNHDLYLLIQDFLGRNFALHMGRLNFQGWRRLTVAIPPQAPDGVNGVVQRSHHFPSQMGIRIMGFRIRCDPMQSFGSYFIYFDDLRAITDLFAEYDRDADDMVDGW